MSIFLTGTNQGLLWGLLALGVFISFRILDFPDLTCEGCFTLGGAVTAILIFKNVNPFLALLISGISGCVAGFVTGFLNTKLKIAPILAGILTMIALYSINIRIMGGSSNLSISRNSTVIDFIQGWLGISKNIASLITGLISCTLFVVLIYWFFGTQFGCAVRATGNNEKMCRAQGVDTDKSKIVGLMISNGLIALSGSLVAQSQNYSDVQMGIGAIVFGLAAVIIGEALFIKKFNFFVKLIMIVVGSVVYRVIIAAILMSDFIKASDFKMITSFVITIALMLPSMSSFIKKTLKRKKERSENA